LPSRWLWHSAKLFLVRALPDRLVLGPSGELDVLELADPEELEKINGSAVGSWSRVCLCDSTHLDSIRFALYAAFEGRLLVLEPLEIRLIETQDVLSVENGDVALWWHVSVSSIRTRPRATYKDTRRNTRRTHEQA
jgi:hypothetical protein